MEMRIDYGLGRACVYSSSVKPRPLARSLFFWKASKDAALRPRAGRVYRELTKVPESRGTRGVEFIEENGGGPGVRLKKTAKGKGRK